MGERTVTSRRRTAGSILSILLTGAFLIFPDAGALAQGQSSIPQVAIPGSQQFSMLSTVVGREYTIDVELPGNYSDTSKAFPVVYLLDAQWDFPLVQAIYGQQYYDGFIPASIIVGITWGGRNPNYDSLRALDLSPTFNARVPFSGNGPKFLSFIKNELIPTIDARYRTDRTNRTLMGSSFGGLFTLYALFQETSLFNRYVLTSPYIGWDNQRIDSIEQEYAQGRAKIPVRVFVAEGGLEQGIREFTAYVDRLASRHYPGLQLETRILEGMGHSGGKAEGFTRGLQSVFRRPIVHLTQSVLDGYVGAYPVKPGIAFLIRRDGGRLVLVSPDGPEYSLVAESENEFSVPGTFLKIQFRTNSEGNVTGMHLERYGREDFFQKN